MQRQVLFLKTVHQRIFLTFLFTAEPIKSLKKHECYLQTVKSFLHFTAPLPTFLSRLFFGTSKNVAPNSKREKIKNTLTYSVISQLKIVFQLGMFNQFSFFQKNSICYLCSSFITTKRWFMYIQLTLHNWTVCSNICQLNSWMLKQKLKTQVHFNSN